MKATTAALFLLSVATLVAAQTNLRPHGMDLIRLLSYKPWITWAQAPRDRLQRANIQHHQDTNLDGNQDNDNPISIDNDEISVDTAKRSAVATVLNGNRRRRQPTPALGKAVTPYVGVGVLNDMDDFFDFLRDNLDGLNTIPSQQRTNAFRETPNVLQIPSAGAGGSGSGMRRLQALRPLRPAGNIRSYNRRSFVDNEEYPGANNHDPGLLWTGLGRR